MGCQTTDFALHQGAGRPINLGNNLPTADHILGHQVVAQGVIHIIQRSCLDEHQCATANFFRRLAQDFYLTAGQSLLCQKLCHAQGNGHVPIMPAGMNGALTAISLLEKQAVHIRAQGHHRAGATAIQRRHQGCGAAHALLYSIAQLTQKACQKRGRANLFKGRLCHSMELGPNFVNMTYKIHD